jgi:hypothetical protein
LAQQDAVNDGVGVASFPESAGGHCPEVQVGLEELSETVRKPSDRACRKPLDDDVLRARSAVPLIGTLGLVLDFSKLRSATGKAGWAVGAMIFGPEAGSLGPSDVRLPSRIEA